MQMKLFVPSEMVGANFDNVPGSSRCPTAALQNTTVNPESLCVFVVPQRG